MGGFKTQPSSTYLLQLANVGQEKNICLFQCLFFNYEELFVFPMEEAMEFYLL